MIPPFRMPSGKIQLWSDPDHVLDKAPMQFHLTYEGWLFGSGRDNPRADHKHEIRKVFHRQLKRLWDISFLNNMKSGVWEGFDHMMSPEWDSNLPMREGLAMLYQRGAYRFVPLVFEQMSLLCSIDILFLRTDPPGSLIKSADIDSRLKTLFDALKMPGDRGQLGKYQTPEEDEDPFYCLLQDDGLITQVSVQTDTLLEPTKDGIGANDLKNDARLVLDIKVRPYRRW